MNEEREVEPQSFDLDAAGDVVIHNPEQVEIINSLRMLQSQCDECISEVHEHFDENESLFGQAVHWPDFQCAKAERWIDSNGELGWRCYCTGIVRGTSSKLCEALRAKIANRGWDNVEVVPE